VDNFGTTLGSGAASAGKGKTIGFTAFFDNRSDATVKDLLDDVILTGTLTTVPEPSTYAMVISGIGLLCAAQRFRSSKQAA
jgi:hypothetical protein